MGDKFRFQSNEDLSLFMNDKLLFRFLGDGNSPYRHLPLTFWMFEKQLTNNNCFEDITTLCDPEAIEYVRHEYEDTFHQLQKYIIPELLKLPAIDEEQFNFILKRRTGLTYLADMHHESSEISLENKMAIVRRNMSNPYEIHRFTVEDICSINKAYKDCMINTNSQIIQGIYESIVVDVNATFTK
jgi:hypothetical protein